MGRHLNVATVPHRALFLLRFGPLGDNERCIGSKTGVNSHVPFYSEDLHTRSLYSDDPYDEIDRMCPRNPGNRLLRKDPRKDVSGRSTQTIVRGAGQRRLLWIDLDDPSAGLPSQQG